MGCRGCRPAVTVFPGNSLTVGGSLSGSSVWLSASLGGCRQTPSMDDLDPDFLDAYRAACDDLDVEPLPVPDLVKLITALLGTSKVDEVAKPGCRTLQ